MLWIDRVNRVVGERFAWLYLVAVFVTAYEVVMRYVFNAPTTWGFELTVLLCAICYLVGGGYVTQGREHIAITVLRDRAGPRLRWWLDLTAHLVGIFAMGGLAWSSWKSGVRAISIVERTGSAWDSPSPAIIKPLIGVAAFMILLQLLVHLVRHFRHSEA
jgi:TRAP-type C4-dicarboxylate transport system permease small subunit